MKHSPRVLLSLIILIILNYSAFGQQSSNTTLIGRWPNGPCFASFVVDNIAYIGNGGALEVLDISNPSSPKSLGQIALYGAVADIFVDGEYAYVVTFYAFYIFNISNPKNPIEMGYFKATGNSFQSIHVSGRYAYITVFEEGLKIFDVINKSNPTAVGFFNTQGQAYDVFVLDNYAYVADGKEGLRIININNPANPYEIGFYRNYYYNNIDMGVNVSGNYAYVANWDNGLRIIDVSDPANPSLIGRYSLKENNFTWNIYLSNNLFLAASDGLHILDVGDLKDIKEIGYSEIYDAHDVFVLDNYAYVADGIKGLKIIDVNDPTNPIKMGYFRTADFAWNVYFSERYAYVADGNSGLHIIDINNPAKPAEVGTFDLDSYTISVDGVYVSGIYAYLGTNNGLYIIDVKNPSNPILINYLDLGYVKDIYVLGNFAYVAGRELYIIDISNPLKPSEVCRFDVDGARSFYVSGSYVYIAINNGGYSEGLLVLKINNLNNPSNLTQVAHLRMSGDVNYNVYVSDNYAYVAKGKDGLCIIDVSDPTHPYKVALFNNGNYDISDVHIYCNYAYIVGRGGLRIIDVTNHSNPIEVGYFDTGSSSGIFANGKYAYVASGDDGVYIIEFNGLPQFCTFNLSFHQNPAFSEYIHFIPVCFPEPDQIELKISNTIKTDQISLSQISEGIYSGSYQLNDSGTYKLELRATKEGKDSTLIRNFYVQLIKSSVGGNISICKNLHLIIPPKGLQNDFYICSMPLLTQNKGDTLGIYQIGPPIDLNKNALLEFQMDEKEQVQIYFISENNAWNLLPTSNFSNSNIITTEIKKLGKIGIIKSENYQSGARKMELSQNYPNPFNLSTRIKYYLPQDDLVKITIYNIIGKKVKELLNTYQSEGYHTIIWDGKADNGHFVSTGIYIYRFETATINFSKKMMLIR